MTATEQEQPAVQVYGSDDRDGMADFVLMTAFLEPISRALERGEDAVVDWNEVRHVVDSGADCLGFDLEARCLLARKLGLVMLDLLSLDEVLRGGADWADANGHLDS